MRDKWILGLILIYVGFLLGTVDVMAAENIRLLEPSNRTRRGDDPIKIYVPPDISVERLRRWRLYLDEIDVTSLIQRRGELAVLQPPQSLVAGSHKLRLEELLTSGETRLLRRWTIRVGTPKQAAAVRFHATGEARGSKLVAERDNPDAPGGTVQGSGQLRMTVGRSERPFEGTGQFVFDSEENLSPDDRQIDISEFLLRQPFAAGSLSGVLSAGHRSLEQPSLIREPSYNRRGFFLDLRTPQDRIHMQGFFNRTERLSGLQEGLGVGDPDNRTVGGLLQYAPLNGNPEALQLQVTTLAAQGLETGFSESSTTEVGAGTFSESPNPPEGQASSLQLKSKLFDRRLTLRGEAAVTSFDFDGDDTGTGDISDQGFNVSLNYRSPRSRNGSSAPAWSLGGSYQRLGPFFRSLARPGNPQDLETLNLHGQMNWTRFGISTNLTQLEDNVDDEESISTVRTRSAVVNLSWSPFVKKPPPDWSWLGRPSFEVSGSLTDDEQTQTPTGFSVAPVDRLERSIQLGANVQYPDWNWSLSHRITTVDKPPMFGDSNINYLQGSLNVPLGTSATLSPYLQYSLDENQATHVELETYNAGLSTSWSLYENWLSGSLMYDFNESETSDGSTDFASHTIDLSLSWPIILENWNVPTLEFTVNGAYQDVEQRGSGLAGTSFTEDETLRVFATLSLQTDRTLGLGM